MTLIHTKKRKLRYLATS